MHILIGIDWSQDHHDVCILHENGSQLLRCRIAHTPQGFQQLGAKIDQFRLKPEQCLIGLETAHNLLVDYLLARQYTVYVLAPTVVKGGRGRFGASGARSDRQDALLLADMLRTDRARFTPWQANTPLVREIEAQLRLIDDLTGSITRYGNRLRASLLRYYPQALDLFSDLTTQICLQFLVAFPSPAAARALSFAQFDRFCRQHGYSHPQRITAQYAHLQRRTWMADPAVVQAYQAQTPFLAELLLTLVRQKNQVLRQAQQLFQQHPDAAIFASLPGAGQWLQPSLLVMFGDQRSRYPSPMAIQALAGTCPITVQSGKSRIILFRKACNRRFRQTAQQWARASVAQSDWAAAYFSQLRARGHAKSHAFRCLANRWLAIAWTLWQRCQPYDEAYHLRQVQQRRRPPAAARIQA